MTYVRPHLIIYLILIELTYWASDLYLTGRVVVSLIRCWYTSR